MAVEWREDLSVGAPELDDQHKELFNRFNAFLKVCDSGKGTKEILNLLQYLDSYAAEHFAAEERLQKETDYPALEQHKADHRYFIYKLERLKQHAESTGVTLDLVLTANNVLVRWLIEHISGMDRTFGQYLKTLRQSAA